jgi:HEAT repeat protein
LEYQDKIHLFLKEWAKALRAYNLYPSGHPALASQTDFLNQILTELAGWERFSLEFEISRSDVKHQGKQLSASRPLISGLANHIYRRCLRRVTFLPDITSKEIHEFLQIISLSEDEIRSLGGIKAILELRGVSGLEVVEVSFQEVLPEEESIASLELEDEIVPEPEPDVDERTRLRNLLEDLKNEEDLERVSAVLSEFIEVLRPLIDLDRRMASLEALQGLTRMVSDSRVPSEKRSLLIQALGRVLALRAVESILSWLVPPGEIETKEVLEVFRAAGPGLLPNLVEGLIGFPRGWIAKLPVSELLSLFPEDEVIKMLAERVRSAPAPNIQTSVFLLGYLGGEMVIPILKEMLSRGEGAVPREVISCLSRIGGKTAARVLMNYYFGAPAELKHQVLVALGSIRRDEVFPFLSQISWGDSSPALRKGAMAALGILGDQRVVPLLVRILKKQNWFHRLPSELEMQAAVSLAEIGGNQALAFLIQALQTRSLSKTGSIWEALGRLEEKIGLVSGT